MTGTDLEVELIGKVDVANASRVNLVPAPVLILPRLPEKPISGRLGRWALEIRSGRFRSTLSHYQQRFPSVDHSGS